MTDRARTQMAVFRLQPSIAWCTGRFAQPGCGRADTRRMTTSIRHRYEAHDEPQDEPLWSPESTVATHAPPPTVSPASEAGLLAVFDAPLPNVGSTYLAYVEREREVLAAIASLDPRESYALVRRLRAQRPDDPIVQRLRRFEPARRARVVEFACDSKRRAALAARTVAAR
jgi:hypothetical protein